MIYIVILIIALQLEKTRGRSRLSSSTNLEVFFLGDVTLTLEQTCSSVPIEYRCSTTYAFLRWEIEDQNEIIKIDFHSAHEVGKMFRSGRYTAVLTDIKEFEFSSSLSFQYFQAENNMSITCIDGHDGLFENKKIQLTGRLNIFKKLTIFLLI